MAVIIYILAIITAASVVAHIGALHRIKRIESELEDMRHRVLAAQCLAIEHMKTEHPEIDRLLPSANKLPITYIQGHYIWGV